LHTKLGRGGLSDVEWTVQLIQLRAAGRHPELRTTGTLPALAAARDLGLLSPDDAQVLTDAWQLATRVRNAIMLAVGRPADAVPTDPRSLASVAGALGYRAGSRQQLVEDYRRAARRARAVYERVFFDEPARYS
jgi:glutamate-ammonia-ligase adenylyltransferase